MDPTSRRFGRVAVACALGLLALAGAPAAHAAQQAQRQQEREAARHPIDSKTLAAIDRQAKALLAEKGVTHVGFYGFVIDREGHVVEAWVVRSAGEARLDEMALGMIRKAVLKHRPAHSPAKMQFIVPIEFRRKAGGKAAPAAH